ETRPERRRSRRWAGASRCDPQGAAARALGRRQATRGHDSAWQVPELDGELGPRRVRRVAVDELPGPRRLQGRLPDFGQLDRLESPAHTEQGLLSRTVRRFATLLRPAPPPWGAGRSTIGPFAIAPA